MQAVTFEDLIPPERHDDIPWTTLSIEEAPDSDGPWKIIDTIALLPLDSDPAEPQERSVTTTHGTLDDGWYRLTFVDANGATSRAFLIQNKVDAIKPTVDELGKLMRARTKVSGSGGGEAGTFNANTRPTAVEAQEIIERAADAVRMRVGPIPDHLAAQARFVVTLMAAQLVELSYYPEQTNAEQSAYAQYNALYESAIAALELAVQDDQPGTPHKRAFSLPLVGENGYTPLNRRFPFNWLGDDVLA